MYLADNDDVFPRALGAIFNPPGGYAYNCMWHDPTHDYMNEGARQGPLFKYMQSMKFHLCPTSEQFALAYGKSHPGHNSSIPFKPIYSYSQNVYLGLDAGVLKGSQVYSPEKVITFVEENMWPIPGYASHTLNDTVFWPRHTNDPANFEGDGIASFHDTSLQKKNDGLGNAVFFDGHVDMLDYKEEFEFSWGTLRASFMYAWPKDDVSEDCPYH